MSDTIFPSFPGLSWDVKRSDRRATMIQSSANGREVRIPRSQDPLWDFELSYEFLRDDVVHDELNTLLAFWEARQGAYDSFLLDLSTITQLASDGLLTAAQMGVGNGAKTAFQITHPRLGFNLYNLGADLAVNTGNLVLYPQALNNAVWTGSGWTVTANSDTAPDGTVTADTLSCSANADLGQNLGNIAEYATYYTVVAFLKAGTASAINLRAQVQGFPVVSGEVSVNMTNGTIAWYVGTVAAPTITAVGNGWYGVAFVILNNTYNTQLTLDIWTGHPNPNPDSTFYTGTTKVWNAQIFRGNYGLIPYPASIANGLITFNQAPPSGFPVLVGGHYYYRVRFEDQIDVSAMLHQLYELQQLKLVGCRE